MEEVLLERTKIGEQLAVSCEMEDDEVGFFISRLDVSTLCGFKFKEWTKFVEAVNKANTQFLKKRGVKECENFSISNQGFRIDQSGHLFL